MSQVQRPLTPLYAEHYSIAAVLRALETLVRWARERAARIDPKVFRAMISYLGVFPEREHHPKEESVLFARIRRRTREGDALLDELTREHESGERAIRELEQAFLRYEAGGDSKLPHFAAAVERFTERYLEHMRKEEREVIPLAERVLGEEDWAEIEAAFAAHRDPLAGVSPETDHDELLHRIVCLVPAPLGLGPTVARK